MENTKARKLFEGAITRKAIIEAFKKLNPAHMIKNPVMFTVYVGSILTTGLWLQALTGKGESEPGFIFAVSLWLWFTVVFANFAEAMAEGRGKAQADTLRKSRQEPRPKNWPRLIRIHPKPRFFRRPSQRRFGIGRSGRFCTRRMAKRWWEWPWWMKAPLRGIRSGGPGKRR
jgi:hypothetical protein